MKYDLQFAWHCDSHGTSGTALTMEEVSHMASAHIDFYSNPTYADGHPYCDHTEDQHRAVMVILTSPDITIKAKESQPL